MRVKFIDIGYGNANWIADMEELTEAAVVREVKRAGAVMSRQVSAVLDDSGKTGEVIVGMFRLAGRFKVID